MALVNGAESVTPKKTLKKAREYYKKNSQFILAGERGGVKPNGFDVGNSPLEFSHKKVVGKQIILTSTSGTKAIVSAKSGKWVLIGALLNAKAVASAALNIAEKERRGISLILSGNNGLFSLEDFICAGAIADVLTIAKIEPSDSVFAALLAFKRARKSLSEVIQKGQHAQYLNNTGFREDVNFCSQLDISDVVPHLLGDVIIPFRPSLNTGDKFGGLNEFDNL
jgi:2-phosphosulfolactate phosphatase